MFTELSYFAAQMVSVTSLALMGLTVLISQPRNINARLFALICLSTITYIVSAMQYKSNAEFRIDLSAFWLPLQIVMNTGAGFLMLLCFSLFQDSRNVPRWMLVFFAGQVCLSALRPLYVPNEIAAIDVESIGTLNYFIFGTLPILLQSLFALTGTYWVIRGWQADVVESRRLLRRVTIGFIAVLFVGVTLSELVVMNSGPEQLLRISEIKTYSGAALLFVTALFCLKFESILESISITTVHPVEEEFDAEQEIALSKFYDVFRDQKTYLEPGLSIAELAKKLAMPQYKLRHLINKRLGYRNFNALLNEYRIKDACEMLSDSGNDQMPILTIALTVGYQSIAPFNQAFRELIGLTPSDYRKRAQQDEFLANAKPRLS
ncbi:MAG: helix-turn-helix domain-containing protein [Pseudomonadales bacterium]|nr:helix-turn-helix domain-containing protein [Pseudomonadales bacterium]